MLSGRKMILISLNKKGGTSGYAWCLEEQGTINSICCYAECNCVHSHFASMRSTIRFRAVRLFYIHRCSLSTQLKHAHQKDQIFIQIFQLDQFHFCSWVIALWISDAFVDPASWAKDVPCGFAGRAAAVDPAALRLDVVLLPLAEVAEQPPCAVATFALYTFFLRTRRIITAKVVQQHQIRMVFASKTHTVRFSASEERAKATNGGDLGYVWILRSASLAQQG